MKTKIKCLECGREVKSINSQHLKSCCGLNLDEYKIKYPHAETMSEEDRLLRRENAKNLKHKTKFLPCSNCGGNPIEVPSQRSSYICDTCMKKGIKSTASENGKLGSDKIQQLYKNDPSKKEQMKQKVSKKLKNIFKDPVKKQHLIDQRKQTYKNNTGFDHYMKNPENVKHVFDLRDEKEIQKKKEETNLKNIGYKCHLQDPEFRKTITEKYFKINGVYHWAQTEEGKKYLRDVGLKRHDKNRTKILEALNIELCDPEYINSHYDHIWLCKVCNNKFKTCWNNIQQGYLCPTCFPRNGGTSIAETEIFNFIQAILPNELILKNNKNIIYPYELDIFIPSRNFAIEHNGLLWHSNDINHDRVDKFYHLTKTNMCKKNNIKLLHIFEDEWLYKKEIVKNRIGHILGINNSTRIHGRDCIIKEIETPIKNQFLNLFHIQGLDISTINLGAFYNDQLVAVMTFSHGNISKGSRRIEGMWELNRFCTDYNYHIPGIAKKLLVYFQRNYDWKKIYSYADLRWSDGNLYNKLGFNLDYYTQPNYWYIKGYNRIHRFNLRKRPDEPKDISEKLLRLKEGYRILYDCGSLKFSIINQ